MKNILTIAVCTLACLGAFAQVQVDKKIEMTGATPSDKKIEGIEEVINSHDAVNKEYVDTAIANRAGSSSATFTFDVTLDKDTVIFAGFIGWEDRVTISVNRLTGNVGIVYLEASGFPAGLSWDFFPGAGFISFESQIKVVQTVVNMSAGVYPITITATGGGTVVTKTFYLKIVPAKRVFVTSTTYQGNLGSAATADGYCQTRADAAGLGGTWKSWTGFWSSSPNTRFTQNNGPYVTVNGDLVADDYAHVINQSKDYYHPINLNEFGQTLDTEVWTNVQPNGNTQGTNVTQSCNNFTSNSSSYGSWKGFSNRVDYGWTDYGPTSTCNKFNSLYCFEQ